MALVSHRSRTDVDMLQVLHPKELNMLLYCGRVRDVKSCIVPLVERADTQLLSSSTSSPLDLVHPA